jgi:drug/metabolite transporter (DMT)-like permease
MKTHISSICLVISATIVGSLAGLSLKLGVDMPTLSIMNIATNKKLLLGLFLHAVGVFVFFLALRGGELSVLTPFESLTYIWTILLARYVLHERIGHLKLFGIALIVIGVTVVGLGNK